MSVILIEKETIQPIGLNPEYPFTSSSETTVYDYYGSAKGMEGVGIRKILDQMKRDNITLKYYSHDDDSCSRSLIREYFPKALEYLDIGHAAKNIKKKIIEAGRNTEYHQLRGFGERMQRDFRFLVKKYHKDPKILSYQIMNMADHYSGKHSNCDHEAFTAKYNTLSCPNTIKYVKYPILLF